MKKVAHRAFIAGALLSWAAVPGATADLLWDNNIEPGPLNGWRATSPPTFPNIRVADDIVVDEPGWRITMAMFSAVEDSAWVSSGILEVYVYSDLGGENGPGVLVAESHGPYEREDMGRQFFSRDDYRYHVDLSDDPITLGPGKYWIGHRDAGAGGSGTSYWGGGNDGGPDGMDSSTGWFSLNAGETWAEEGRDIWHHAFVLEGDIVPAPGAVVVFGLAVLRFRRRRR